MSSKSKRLIVLGALCLALGNIAHPGAQSQSRVDLARERAELLQLHRNARDAHFKTNVGLLLDHRSDEILYVRDGRITRRSKRAMRDLFTAYFRGAKYYEWDDIEPPVVHVSQDASMGWMVTSVRVRRTQTTPTGTTAEEFVYAGMYTYEKRDGRWFEVANASTFEPRK